MRTIRPVTAPPAAKRFPDRDEIAAVRAEADPGANKLSNESPVGKAIIGHKKGETVEVTAPRGMLKFKILEIKAA